VGAARVVHYGVVLCNSKHVIRFEQVSKVYAKGAPPALDRISLDIQRGEFVFLVGSSGSGKSTCMSLVLREESPTAGRIFVAGHNLGAYSSRKIPQLRRTIGTVFQDFRLLPSKSVYENVAFALEVIGKPRHYIKTTVPETLEMVGLRGKEKRLPHELSGGEQQRVAIARAFVNRPLILLADEPTGNLDPITSLGIMRVLELINSTGTTVVMATHDFRIVDDMRKRVIELDRGHIVRDERMGQYLGTGPIPIVQPAQVHPGQLQPPFHLVNSAYQPAAARPQTAPTPVVANSGTPRHYATPQPYAAPINYGEVR